MSNEKNPEVVGCDASIMRNVWEIREKEYGQKIQQEQDRIQRSALSSINKDWENRLAVRLGKGTRVERKPKRRETDAEENVWKSKQPQAPPTLPRGIGSGPLGMPGGQKKGTSSQASSMAKRGQDKNLIKFQLLMSITQNQPSAMVWGKSWKNNKSLPSQEEGAEAAPGWGKCWMFATHQPYSEPGKPWVNGPNLMDPHNLHLWKKLDYRVVESEELDLSLPIEEWQMSWRKSDKKNKKGDTTSVDGEDVHKPGLFTLLMETQHHYEGLSSSEWSDSWRSTKPASREVDFTENNGQMNESMANKQDNNRKMSSNWEECWRLANHHGCNNSKLPKVKKSHSSTEWAESWRAAMKVSNNHKNADSSLRQGHGETYNDHSHQKESHLHEDMFVYHEQKYRDLYMQLCDEFMTLSEWSKSWQVTKNNSKPCEEIEKVLKLSPPKMEAQKVENNTKGNYSTSDKVDPSYEQLKHSVIYHPRREFAQSNLLHLKHLEKVLPAPEWRDSWKALKHRMRMERRRMRPDPSRPFGASEKGGDMKPNASDLKDSWKFNCHPLRQEPEFWQQGWPTIPQIRVDRARDQNHFAPVELPKNGPTGERSWGESWRFSRPQQRSQGQGRAQTSQGRSSMASQYPDNSQAHRPVGHSAHTRSVFDWQDAWMFSETQFHHDKPSLTQWREAWKSSGFNTELWAERVPRENAVYVLMEIHHRREKISLQKAQAKMSRSFDNQMFRERYPEKQWNASWKNGSLLNPGMSGKTMSSPTQQHHTPTNGHGSKWGMSFRIANPMPQVERPWVESFPNPCHYAVMWSRGKDKQRNAITTFCSSPAIFKLWINSKRFLQGASAQIKDKTMSKKSIDPRVIITKHTQTKEHLYASIDKEIDKRKWAGVHLLGKTQPRPTRGPTSGKKPKTDETDSFFEEWAESWRFFVQPSSLKQTKSLSGWNKSWKFLIPPYPPTNGLKAK